MNRFYFFLKLDRVQRINELATIEALKQGLDNRVYDNSESIICVVVIGLIRISLEGCSTREQSRLG